MKRLTIASVLLRDKTLDWIDAVLDGPWIDRGCWAVITFAAGYFGLHFFLAYLRR